MNKLNFDGVYNKIRILAKINYLCAEKNVFFIQKTIKHLAINYLYKELKYNQL
jgi:hypothetical protein